jgi:MATE family multidrug resistance protein
MAVVAMAVSALVMFVIPEKIVGIYTSEPDVATLAVELLYLAALFQVSDGLQAAAVGALRGLRDTTWPMCITFVAYWILGLPLAYWLGIKLELGPSGLWAGLIVGLTFAAVFLTVRFRILSRQGPPLQRTPATDV